MANTTSYHWHILGAGAIGSLWACHAYKSGRSAPLILRDRQRLHDYQRDGGIMAQLGNSAELLPVPVLSPDTITQNIDHVLIATKAQQTLAALNTIADKLNRDPTLVLLQNGMGAAELILKRFPTATVLQASTTEGAYRQGPFSVIHAGKGHTLLGCLNDTAMDDRELTMLAESLSVGSLKVEACTDIYPVLWRKLAVNSIINPLTVKYRCRNGELLDNPLAAQEMVNLSAEFELLSQAMGRGAWLKDPLSLARQVAADTALNRSSMLQDVEAGRETEVDFITGHLCDLATQHHVDLPLHQHLLSFIHHLQRR